MFSVCLLMSYFSNMIFIARYRRHFASSLIQNVITAIIPFILLSIESQPIDQLSAIAFAKELDEELETKFDLNLKNPLLWEDIPRLKVRIAMELIAWLIPQKCSRQRFSMRLIVNTDDKNEVEQHYPLKLSVMKNVDDVAWEGNIAWKREFIESKSGLHRNDYGRPVTRIAWNTLAKAALGDWAQLPRSRLFLALHSGSDKDERVAKIPLLFDISRLSPSVIKRRFGDPLTLMLTINNGNQAPIYKYPDAKRAFFSRKRMNPREMSKKLHKLKTNKSLYNAMPVS